MKFTPDNFKLQQHNTVDLLSSGKISEIKIGD